MYKYYISVLFFFVICAFFASCNDTGYEIEEHEETEAPKTETKTEIKQDVEQPKTDIKQEINKEKKVPEKQYTIQLGAFGVESNAMEFVKKAKKSTNIEINYYFIDGLYKVRVGVFSSRDDAITALMKLEEAGYPNSFITELNK